MDPIERWDELHARTDFAPRYPEPEVVRWTFRNFSRKQAEKFCLLDVGCGCGRHSAFWAQNGYQAVASDASEEAIGFVRELSGYVGFSVARDRFDNLHWPDDWFHGVLCWGVLYYGEPEKGISEIHRVLRPGGKALFKIRSTEDTRASYLVGGVLEPGPDGIFADEAGLPMKFYAPWQARELFSKFSDVEIERHSRDNGRVRHDDLVVKVVK